MTYQEKLLSEFTVEELDRELVARGAQIPGERQFKFRDREGGVKGCQVNYSCIIISSPCFFYWSGPIFPKLYLFNIFFFPG